MAGVATARRLMGRDDSDEGMNVNESGGEECSAGNDLMKRGCTRGITSVDGGC